MPTDFSKIESSAFRRDAALSIYEGTTKSTNASVALATTSHCGTISSNQTWSSSGNVHVVTCNVIVASGATLTIQAGAIIKLSLNTRITINGKLLVQGTEPAPVIITSYKDDEYGGDTNGNGASVCAPGDWDGIFFGDTSDDTSLVDHALIRCAGDGYYGRAGINLDNASPTVQNSEFRQDAYCGVQGDLHSFPKLIGNTYTGNAANGFCLLPQSGETIDANSTWAPIDTSYYVRGNITVILGKTLTLSPGIVVKVGLNNRLTINGKLLVQGTEPAPVIVTSYKDDEYGVGNNWDTNGNGTSACAPGEWDGIFFGDTSDDTSLVDHALIRCAGDAYYKLGAINLDAASPTMKNSTLTKNAIGVVANATSSTFGCNNIYGNSNYGLYNKTPTTIAVAENQWWGDPSGPYHPTLNSGGNGNAVSNGVDFIPFRTSPCGTVPQTFQLTVNKTGNGNGTVTSNPAGINCGSDCSEAYSYNTIVILIPTPVPGSTFTGWTGGGCSGAGTCTVTLTAATTVTANFDLQPFTLTVNKTGNGNGTVTSSPTGINCGSDCSEAYVYNTSVTLTPTPVAGSSFAGWSGTCSGIGSCIVIMTAARSVTATFTTSSTPVYYMLTVNTAGTGHGAITGTGISCPGDCSETYVSGTVVALTATPDSSSTFTGWSGNASGTTNLTNVTMIANKSVTANFTQGQGQTFEDVPSVHIYYIYIEILYANGLTAGCTTSPLKFCPDEVMNRAQSAVFMLRGNYGSSYNPPAATHVFGDDWIPGAWAEKWADAMFKTNLSAGCKSSPRLFCPWEQMPREQAVVFALRLKYGKDYTPPAASGTLFADLTDTGYFATKWAEKAYQDGLIPACGTSGGKPKFCPKELVSRGLGAYMIVRAKNLTMP